MAKRKTSINRTDDQKRHDRTLAMMLHLQDFTYREISAIIERETGRSISPRQVGYDIQHVRDSWKEMRLDNYQRYINEELTRLDSMEMELWNSWRKSQKGFEREKVEKVINDTIDENPEASTDLIVKRVVTTTETGAGDTKYLQLILDVQKERRKLLGLYAPAKLDIQSEHTLNIKGYYGVSPDDWPEPGSEPELLDDGNTVDGEYEEVESAR